jgi:hypothetical protein
LHRVQAKTFLPDQNVLSVNPLLNRIMERKIDPRHIRANSYCVRPLTPIEAGQNRHEIL